MRILSSSHPHISYRQQRTTTRYRLADFIT